MLHHHAGKDLWPGGKNLGPSKKAALNQTAAQDYGNVFSMSKLSDLNPGRVFIDPIFLVQFF